MSSLRACFRTLVACAVLWCCVSPAIAGVRRDDRDDSLHTSLASESPYAAVGQVRCVDGSGNIVLGSGTHIGDGWIVTAAHCFTSTQPGQEIVRDPVEFIVGPYGAGSGETISSGDIYAADVSEVHVHPLWNSGNLLGGNDVAVFRLQSGYDDLPVATLAPIGTQPVGRPATAVGYGRTGVGSTGWTLNSVGTKRAGTNMIDLRGGQIGPEQDGGVYLNASGVATSILLSDFDEPDNSNASLLGEQTPLDQEYSIAPGDSGGALMIVDPSDPQNQLLAGIHSFGASVQAETDDERIIGDVNGFVDSSYGELQGYTDVSAPPIANFIYDKTGIPEPATMVLLVSMGGLLLRRRASR